MPAGMIAVTAAGVLQISNARKNMCLKQKGTAYPTYAEAGYPSGGNSRVGFYLYGLSTPMIAIHCPQPYYARVAEMVKVDASTWYYVIESQYETPVEWFLFDTLWPSAPGYGAEIRDPATDTLIWSTGGKALKPRSYFRGDYGGTTFAIGDGRKYAAIMSGVAGRVDKSYSNSAFGSGMMDETLTEYRSGVSMQAGYVYLSYYQILELFNPETHSAPGPGNTQDIYNPSVCLIVDVTDF